MNFLIPPVLAILNRMRGDDTWMPKWLPGRALFYVAPFVGLITWVVASWPIALTVAGTYLTWALTGWGRWFDLGRMPPLTRERSALERAIEAISFGSDHIALFWRHMLITPGLALISYLTLNPLYLAAAPLIALAFVLCYEIAWRVDPRGEPIRLAELIVGALWGVLIVTLDGY